MEVFVKLKDFLRLVYTWTINPLGIANVDQKFLDRGEMQLRREGKHCEIRNVSFLGYAQSSPSGIQIKTHNLKEFDENPLNASIRDQGLCNHIICWERSSSITDHF